MKKILISICLFTVWITSYSQINCNGTSASTVNPTDKLAICNGNLQRTVTASQLVDAGIDTTKVGRIQQGRGTAPIFMYFNGVAWVRNDTSYVAQTGTNKFSGNFLSNQSFLQVGLGSANNTLTFTDEVFTGIKSASATSETQISAYSTTNGYADISVYNPLGGLYDRRMVITGTGNNTPDQSFRIQNGLLYYFGNYTAQMTDDRTVPDIGKVKQLISDSIGTVQSTTLPDGKIWIGDGTDTAFPRALSGDVTVNNLGVTSYNGVVPAIKGGTGQSMVAIGNLLYGSGVNTWSKLSGNYYQTRKFLYQNGSGTTNTVTGLDRLLTTDMTEAEKVPIGFTAASILNAFGDSYTLGTGASITAKNYVSSFAELIGNSITINNYGVGGIGGFNCFTEILANTSSTNNPYPTLLMCTLNDVANANSSGGTNAGYNRIANEHRAIITNALLKTAVAANNGSVSTTGTWTTLPSASNVYRDKSSFELSGLARTSSVSGSTLTYSFTGNSLVIGTWGCDVTNFDLGQFTVTVDGVLRTIYNPTNKGVYRSAAYEQGINHDAIVLFGLGGGTHTLVIATTQNKPTYIDYIGTLQAPSSAPTMLVGGLTKLTSAGYALGTVTINDSIFDYTNDLIKTVINEFRINSYNISFVNTNRNFVPATMIGGDNIHPNDIGYGVIAQNFSSLISNAFIPSQNQYLVLQGRSATQQSLFRAINDGSVNVNMGVYASGTSTNGIEEANMANLRTTATKLNIGSLGAVNFFTGGVASSNQNVSITSTGSFGIGVVSPIPKLHVAQGGSVNSLFTPTASIITPILFTSNKITNLQNIVSNDTVSRRGLFSCIATGGTNASPTAVGIGRILGSYSFYGYDGGASTILGADISAVVENTVSLGVMPTYLTLATTQTNLSIERMRITSTGYVGIGTASPASKLSVLGNASIGATYATIAAPTSGAIIEGDVGIGIASPASKLDVYGGALGGTTGNTVALAQVGMPTTNAMYLQTTGVRLSTGTTWREAAIRQQLTVDASSGMGYIQYEGFAAIENVGGISFGTVNSSVTAPFSVPERMRITNIGNVGIGVTAPSSLLDVAGNVEMRHLIGNTGTPSIAAGAGAGTTPTVTLSNATDMSGIVNVTTGTIPTGTNAVVATITFETAYGQAPNVVLYPNNANTAILSGVSMVYTTSTTTTFVITSGTTALTASTAYKWFYQVVQ